MKRHFLLVGVFMVGTALVFAADPSWWTSGNTRILSAGASPDNYAPANLGQLKLVVKQAKEYLDLYLPGGAGPAITQMAANFEPRQEQGYTAQQIEQFKAANYAPANLGQLKAVAKPFYDRLLAVGYDTKQNLISHGYPNAWSFDYPWNPATPVSDNYVPANLGQLKMTFSFDISTDSDGDGLTDLQEASLGTDPHASDVPINLTAHGQWAGIDLAWQAGSASAPDSFLIERRESMDTAGPFTPWQELDWVPGTSPEYHDFWLEHGEYVIYRVRAVFGSGENEWRSAPSNLARAVRWIDLGGGIYGPPPGGDDGSGGGPVIDPPGGDDPPGGGGDDPPIDGDGDGDGDPDNDDDGVMDIFDRYPNDPRRSEDIPFKFYAVLNPNPDGTFQPAAEDPVLGTTIQLNINDSSDFAWGGLGKTADHGDDGGEIWEYRSAWRQGDSAGQETAVRLYEQQGNGIRYSYLYPIGAGVPNAAGSHGIFAGNVGVLRLVHTEDGWVSPDSDSVSGRYTIEQGVITYELVTARYGDWVSKTYLGISQYGKPFGLDRFATGSNSSRRYHQHASIAGVDIPAFASTSIMEGEVPYLSLKAMSPTGISVVQRHVVPDPPVMYLCEPDGSARVVPLPLDVFAINDQRQVVGQLDQSFPNSDPSRGTLGFLWSPASGLNVFHDLMPKEHRKQFRNAIPYLISNRDKKLKLYRITFSAECWKTVGTAADWVAGTFVFEKKDNKEPTIQEISLPSVDDATLGQPRPMDVAFTAPTVPGPFAGMVGGGDAPTTATAPGGAAAAAPAGRKPAIVPDFEFRSMDIVKGFDPFLAGDVHFDGDSSTEDPIDDKINPREWWTSVCQTPTPTPAIRDLNLNNHLALVFPGGVKIAKDYELVVEPSVPVPPGDPLKNSSNWITFTDISPLAAGNQLEIKGKAYVPTEIGKAKLLLRQISTATTQAVLKVMVLPHQQLRLAMWDVYHPGRAGTTVGSHSTAADVLKAANEAFAQACISFVPPTEPPAWVPAPIPYDVNPADDVFDDWDPTEFSAMASKLNQEYNNFAEANLLCLHTFKPADFLGITSLGGPISFLNGSKLPDFGEFTFTAMHELGHQMSLGTRAIPNWNNKQAKNHDDGNWPKAYALKSGRLPTFSISSHLVTARSLMTTGYYPYSTSGRTGIMSTFWLRHEDWEAANTTAKAKTLSWQIIIP